MKLRNIFFILLFSITLTACSDKLIESNNENKQSEKTEKVNKIDNKIQEKNNFIVKTVDVNEFKKYISKKDTILIDLRTPEELKQTGVIDPKAINLDVYNPNFPNELNKLDRNKTYLIYCRSGSRSSQVRKFMKKLGFKNIIELKGGIINWYNKGEKFYKYKNNEKE